MSDVPGPGHPLASHKSEVRRRLGIGRRGTTFRQPGEQSGSAAAFAAI